MKITCLLLIVLSNLATTTEVYKEYDDPSTSAYRELHKDYTIFYSAIIRSNAQRPGQYFLLTKKERSCENRCQETRNSTLFCHCDKHCALYQDCCIDYWKKCRVSTKPYNRSTQMIWTCVDCTYKRPKGRSYKLPYVAYMMITKCPTTNSSNDCSRHGPNKTELSDITPVTGDDGLTYGNRYCAKCHGVQNFTFWGFNVYCSGENDNETRLDYNSPALHRNCTWYFAPPNTTNSTRDRCSLTKLCENAIKTPESIKYADLVNKCKSYMQLIFSGGVVYRNFHCASCNGVNLTDFHKPGKYTKLPTLTIFFDYRPTTRDKEEHNGQTGTPGVNGTTGINRRTRNTIHDVIAGYLTVIGLSLSITCLILVIITYIWFPKLRTVPGLVLLSLSLSLLSYQVLLLATPWATSQTCKAVAILLHFTILLAFTWMTIMSYDVTKTFAMQGKSAGRSVTMSAFRRYLIISFVIPLVIVGLSFTLGETDGMSVGYGDSGYCWIGHFTALIIFFHIPVGIILIFNTVALVWTIFGIRKVTKLTKNVQKSVKSDRVGQNAKIYSKLSTVMGVTWLLGFGVSHSIVVSYFYIITNSLQGVFIFVTFVLNKRTMNLWRYSASTRGETTTAKTTITRKSRTRKTLSPCASTIQLHDPKGDRESGTVLHMTNMEK